MQTEPSTATRGSGLPRPGSAGVVDGLSGGVRVRNVALPVIQHAYALSRPDVPEATFRRSVRERVSAW